MPMYAMPDGTNIYYEDFGTGTPVVFVSSGNATHAMWDAQVAELALEFRTVTFDWRGTGRSDRPRTGYTAAHVVSDVVTLIAEVIGAPAVVVGHGMGGHIAILAAQQHPEWVAGLGVASSGPWYCGERDGVAGGMSLEFINGSSSGAGGAYPDLLAAMTDTYLFHAPVSADVRTATIQQQLEWPLYVLDRYDEDMLELDHRAALPQITQPALILHGRHDAKQRFSGAAVLLEGLPNAELVVFEDSAHSPHAEEAGAFSAALAALVRRAS